MSLSQRRRSKPAPRRTRASSYAYARCEPRTMLATFSGTAGDDVVTIDVDGGLLELDINGVTRTIGAPEIVEIDGLAGNDTIEISRALGMTTTLIDGEFHIGSFIIALDNFESVDVPFGFDLRGTSGDDVFNLQYNESVPSAWLNGSSLDLHHLIYRRWSMAITSVFLAERAPTQSISNWWTRPDSANSDRT